MILDAIDKKLLTLLQADCKQTTKALSLQLNLSVTAVYERIKKLEQKGIIVRYVALLDKQKVQRDFVVFCHIKLVQHTQENVVQFEKAVAQLDEVLECYHTSGDYDYILKVLVEDMATYREFMVAKLTKLKHIGSTQSMFVINEVKTTTEITL